jgi:hypothetical protein
MVQFLNALIETEGIDLDHHSEGKGRGGRSASYRVTVQANGQLLIGSAYIKQLGITPGMSLKLV